MDDIINEITLSLNDISPTVRHVNLLYCPSGFVEGPRMVYDHQFVYVHSGNGKIEIDGISYNANEGDLFFYGPGIVHAFNADCTTPYVLSGMHFDFTRNFKELSYPIGPFGLSLFRKCNITERVSFNNFCGFPPVINLSHDYRIKELILSMVKEFDGGKIYNSLQLTGLFLTLVSIIAYHVELARQGIESKGDMINSVITFIHNNYNRNLSNESIGKRFHFHPNYLNRIMVANTGMSLRKYLIDLRIRKAMDMIMNTNKSICDISHTVGYDDIHYFSRLFKKKTGFSPLEIKQRL